MKVVKTADMKAFAMVDVMVEMSAEYWVRLLVAMRGHSSVVKMEVHLVAMKAELMAYLQVEELVGLWVEIWVPYWV